MPSKSELKNCNDIQNGIAAHSHIPHRLQPDTSTGTLMHIVDSKRRKKSRKKYEREWVRKREMEKNVIWKVCDKSI